MLASYKHRILTYTALCTVLWAVFASCKRESTVETKYTRLTNTWKLVKLATDDNGNNAIESSEIRPVKTGYYAEWRFNDDSSASETTLVNNQQTVLPINFRFTDRDTLYRWGVGYNTVIYKMTDITSITLQLQTYTNIGLARYYFEKL
jgi:hypothetical protein